MKRTLSLLLILIFGSAFIYSAELPGWHNDRLVTTPYGQILGYPDREDTWVWRGIPYAQPPTGLRRWMAPREVEPWKGVLKAKKFASPGPQFSFILKGKIIGNEDSLYLNIWRPRSTNTNLPVYVFIHGGGNSIGYANQTKENLGQVLAHRENAVYVSMNYRLGPLGWLYHPKLQITGQPEDKSGNYGTLDLIEALYWIQHNIASFGGNPSNVIITGESAGGANVLSLLISPQTKGLFHKAMSQSGYPRTYSLEEGAAFTEKLVAKLLILDKIVKTTNEAARYIQDMKADHFREYLQSQPAHKLLQVLYSPMMGMIAMPLILRDGTVIPKQGYGVLDDGTYDKKVPIILGSNKDENRLFMHFGKQFPNNKALYSTVGDYSADMWKANGVDDLARRFTAVGSPVWAYHFYWGTQDDNGFSVLPQDWGHKLGAFHSLDISFFTGTDTVFSGFFSRFLFSARNKPGRQLLSGAMMDYLSSFHRLGDPSADTPGLPRWQQWSNTDKGPKSLILDADYDTLRLSMMSNEYKAETIWKAMKRDLDEETFKQVELFIIR